MKALKIIFITFLICGLSLGCSFAETKGGGSEVAVDTADKNFNQEKIGTNVPAGNSALSGKIYFSDYYSLGGKRCAAFMESQEGDIFCVFSSPEAAQLKKEMNKSSGKVKVEGKVIPSRDGRYFDIQKYEVIDTERKPPLE